MRLTSFLFRAARASRDVEVIAEAITDASPEPIFKRICNKLIGKYLVSKLWIK